MDMCSICAMPMVHSMLHMCKLHLCAEYVQNMCKLLPYLILCATCMLLVYATYAACSHACYRYAAQVSLTCMHVTACCIHAAYTHASYYIPRMCSFHTCIICSAAYTLLTHMQATSIPRMCSLHHAYYYSAAYFAAHIRHVYSIHAAYIQHTS